MEITLDAIISLVGLFVGGGGGAFFTWRYMRRKAKAEALEAEEEAKAAKVDVVQKVQDTYQQIIADTMADRDHYKQERDELRGELEKLTRQFNQFKSDNERDKLEMKRDIARNGRMVECMRPFLCVFATKCKMCVPLTISDAGEIENTAITGAKDIEPYDDRPDA